MDFDLTEDQQEIKRVARDLLGARSTMARVREAAEARRYDDALWQEIVALGWPGIAVDERHGGQGLGRGRAGGAAGGARLRVRRDPVSVDRGRRGGAAERRHRSPA